MKRMHIHVGVDDLDYGIKFYTTVFGVEPVKSKDDYAKWLLDDPSISFAISTRAKKGVDHLGVQVDQEHELGELRQRLKDAGMSLFDEGETVCCYARSDKSWITDPAGIPWETFRTMEDAQLFSDASPSNDAACSTLETQGPPDCCVPSDTTAGCGA